MSSVRHPGTRPHVATDDDDNDAEQTVHPRLSADFLAKLEQLRLELRSLISITTGMPHPAFPQTMLQFWLLTERQLDSLAVFYHQVVLCEQTWQYPCPVAADWHKAVGVAGVELRLQEKRRLFGRFIGLRGCESPLDEDVEDIVRNARLAAHLDDEDDAMRQKLYWYR